MANPLKLLKLKPTGFQYIQETPIDAPPKRVWASLLDVNNWFGFDENRANWSRQTLEAKPGGLWTSKSKDGTASLLATVTLIEPGKLLRITGPVGLSHLPVTNVFIFELQPQSNGKTTLLRVGQRTFGFVDADLKKRYSQGWKALAQNIKKLAEK